MPGPGNSYPGALTLPPFLFRRLPSVAPLPTLPTATSALVPQGYWPEFLGWLSATGGANSFTTNAAASWGGFAFVCSDNKILSTVRVPTAVTGSLGATDATCELYSSDQTSQGAPLNSLALSNTVATLAGPWGTWSAFNNAYQLVAGQKYWVIFKNLNGTPASNNFTVTTVTGGGPSMPFGGSAGWGGVAKGTTANSGATWTISAPFSGIRLGFADGTYSGVPLSATANLSLFGQNLYGCKFTCPANVNPNVRGLSLAFAGAAGIPTDSVVLELWSGSGSSPAFVRRTQPIQPSQLLAAGISSAWFAEQFAGDTPTVQLTPGGVYRVTARSIGESNANICQRVYQFSSDTDANSLPLYPVDGTLRGTQSADGGSSFTEPSGVLTPGGVLLDTNGPFASAGAAGTPFPLPSGVFFEEEFVIV